MIHTLLSVTSLQDYCKIMKNCLFSTTCIVNRLACSNFQPHNSVLSSAQGFQTIRRYSTGYWVLYANCHCFLWLYYSHSPKGGVAIDLIIHVALCNMNIIFIKSDVWNARFKRSMVNDLQIIYEIFVVSREDYAQDYTLCSSETLAIDCNNSLFFAQQTSSFF